MSDRGEGCCTTCARQECVCPLPRKIQTVYVAGPISADPIGGTRAALDVASKLLFHGYMPFVPHLCVFWELTNPTPYETWLKYDFVWLERCDALLRLPGKSPGADREVEHARKLGRPVFYGLADFLEGVERDA